MRMGECGPRAQAGRFWSQSLFTMLGMDSRTDLMTPSRGQLAGEIDDINLFDIAGPSDLRARIDHIDQTFRSSTPAATGSGLRVRSELSRPHADAAGCT